jgi:diguanylate cyclase (GGDEF)-like protein
VADARSRIEDVMTRRVATATAETPLGVLVATMRDRKLSCLVVCDGAAPVGIVSERDLVRALGEVLRAPEASRWRARDVMSSPVFSISRDAGIDETVALIAERGFRRVPVLGTDGRLVGLVTQSDLLRAHALALERQRQGLEHAVAERTASLVEANRRLEELSSQDALLGIGNRRAMQTALDREHDRARRYGRPYAIALFDVDHFKRYNDRYGHPAGDAVLRTVAGSLATGRRSSDSVHRYGGEEILIVLPETSIRGASVVAERAIGAVAQLALPHEGSGHGMVTLSAGIAAVDPETGDPAAGWTAVVDRADAALYRAKAAGRNRVAE